jgi:hypothetical protein
VLREPVALRGEDTAELLLQRSLKMVGSSDWPVARLPGIAQAPRCEGHPVLAYNVFRLPTAREPTEGRRRAVHRLSQRRCQLARGGKRRSRAAVNGCYLMATTALPRGADGVRHHADSYPYS